MPLSSLSSQRDRRYDRRPLEERLWEKVDRRGPDECWLWLACLDDHGYGVINAGGKYGRACKAHRIAAMLVNGIELKKGVIIRHTCDNPPCCNPAHLIPGTQADNIADMHARGRSGVTGSRSHLAKLNEDQVAEILFLSERGVSGLKLARIYGVTQTNISVIVCRKSWKHVQPGNAVSSPVACMLGSAIAQSLIAA